jgi:hypothetical protein
MRTPSPARYKHHRFPAEIISHGGGLCCRFCLGSRDVEGLLFARGMIVTYEAIRKWCRTSGQLYAHELRRRRPGPGDAWQLEVCQTQPLVDRRSLLPEFRTISEVTMRTNREWCKGRGPDEEVSV